MSVTIVFVAVMVLSVVIGVVAWTKAYRKQKRLHLGATKQALLLIGTEEPKALSKQQGWRVQLHGYVVDVVYQPSSGALFCIHLHRPLTDIPSRFYLECAPQAGVPQQIHRSTPTTLTIGAETYKGTIEEIGRGMFPGLETHIEKLEAFVTEPLRTFKIHERWVSVSRDVLSSSLSQRNISTTNAIEKHIITLINQTAKMLDGVNMHERNDAQMLRDLFFGATPFEALRHKALRDLMQHHRASPEADDVWSKILKEGNLYDALFLLNHDQQRFLRDISPARLLALVNGIQKSKRFETSALPQLLAQRFEFDVVLNPNLDWDVCQALVMLGMRDTSNTHTADILNSLFRQSTYERQVQLMSMATYAVYGPIVSIITSLGAVASPAQALELLTCIEQVTQHTEEGFDRAQTETYLLEVIDRDIQDLTCAAIMALGHVGLVPAMTRLRQLKEGNAWKIGKLNRETKRAMDSIEQRLRQMPNRGGITLTQHDQTSGALSVSTEDGGLEMINHEQ